MNSNEQRDNGENNCREVMILTSSDGLQEHYIPSDADVDTGAKRKAITIGNAVQSRQEPDGVLRRNLLPNILKHDPSSLIQKFSPGVQEDSKE
jgi:hypothetical protein